MGVKSRTTSYGIFALKLGPIEWVQQKRVAVWHSLGDEVRANGAARAGAVFNHHRTAQFFTELLRQDTRKQIRRAPCWEWHDHTDGFDGIRLRPAQRGQQTS